MLVFFEYIDLFYWRNYSGKLKSFKEEKLVLLQNCKGFCCRSKQVPPNYPKTKLNPRVMLLNIEILYGFGLKTRDLPLQ